MGDDVNAINKRKQRLDREVEAASREYGEGLNKKAYRKGLENAPDIRAKKKKQKGRHKATSARDAMSGNSTKRRMKDYPDL